MSCDRALPLLYELVDREIGREDAVWLAEHLAGCTACAATLRQMRAAEGLYGSLPAPGPPPDLAPRIVQSVWADRERSFSTRKSDLLAAGLALAAGIAGIAILQLAGVALPEDAAALLPAGASDLVRLPSSLRLDVFAEFAARMREMWNSPATLLPISPPTGRLLPLLAGLVALQVAGSAWLLRRKEAR